MAFEYLPNSNAMKDNLYNTLPDEMLVRLLSTGDESAYEAIYLRYWRQLYTGAVQKTNDQAAAEELVQELFMSLWENRQKVSIGNLEAYLRTALRYTTITYIKKRLTARETELDTVEHIAIDGGADTGIGLDELSVALQQALTLLPEKTRLVFQMNRFEHRSIADIAKHFGISERAVEYHITQSLRTLRLHLKGYLSYSVILLLLS